jgi:farnesyl-diphosphate farnesyltransferase
MSLRANALEILKKTSRTFYIPISGLPPQLLEAVASAYLCMRAIDEIEDHPDLDNPTKAKILRNVSLSLQGLLETATVEDVNPEFSPYEGILDEVSLRLNEWAILAPMSIAPRIWDATAAMADRMAYWAENNWKIVTKTDLDRYTFSVAGAVGLLLSDLWAWYDGTQTNRGYAIGFGRGLQAVNIVRNSSEDLTRGVSFYPVGWTPENMHGYARLNLKLADLYIQSLPDGPALDFCKIPLALAHGTLEALSLGKEKLSRSDVIALVEKATRKEAAVLSSS